MSWYDFFEPSRPRAAQGGIRARSQRGSFAAQWWGKRWLAVLDALNLGARLQRGRSYARMGQVLDIRIAKGRVTASVQGSRPKPYAVSIVVRQLTRKEISALSREIASAPWIVARLLTGQMPEEIEGVITSTGVSLFPRRSSELETDCSCPDWSNPCKHIAAVYYLLGEEFDRDPFLIFTMRGIEPAALLETLGGFPAADDEEEGANEEQANEPQLRAGASAPADFWEGGRAEITLTSLEPERSPAPLLRRLGNLPFWRGSEPLAEALEPAHAAALDAALDLLAGGAARPRVSNEVHEGDEAHGVAVPHGGGSRPRTPLGSLSGGGRTRRR